MPETQSTNAMLRPLGNTGLRCSPLGFGCYRISDGNDAHEAALREYLSVGGNLIDTSANYGDGHSEILVGKVLREFPRSKVILVTKGGYIQGQNLTLARKRKFPEVVEYGEGIWHSIHPEFLETQVTMSAERLDQEYIDVYLLHNPEYYLEHEAHQKALSPKSHDEFYRRIREAFRFLETKVAAGKLGWYGVSSNNFGLPGRNPKMTSVGRCLEAAQSVSPDHHFRVVQLPLNLYEPGGALEPNNAGKTVLRFCGENGLGVLLNRPLNAFFSSRMIRLADFVAPGQQPPGKERLVALLAPLRRMEESLEDQFDIPLIYGQRSGIATYLETIVPQMKSLAHWEEIFGEYVIQPIQQWAIQCQQLYGERKEWQEWWKEFVVKLQSAFEEISRYVASSQQSVSDEIRAQLQLAGYPPSEQSLSRIAQNVLLHLEGVSCVLNGMRRTEYVRDSMGTMGLPAVDSLSILDRFSRITQQPARPVQ
jgi:aryl-alcohol dehydrogenase-like predicted oxidoreductase